MRGDPDFKPGAGCTCKLCAEPLPVVEPQSVEEARRRNELYAIQRFSPERGPVGRGTHDK